MSIFEELAQEAFDTFLEHYPRFLTEMKLEDSITARLRFYAQCMNQMNEVVFLHPVINMFVEEKFQKLVKDELAKFDDRKFNFEQN
jgi:hypothetical protein